MDIIKRNAAKKLGLISYFTGQPCKHGHISRRQTKCGNCVECKKVWYNTNKKICVSRARQWKKRNKRKVRSSNKKWWENNPTYYTEWKKKNPGVRKALQAKRRAQKLNATPKWVDLKVIKKFYVNCPKGMVVDHIVPLLGKNVCGLHIICNLQYLTNHDNCRKHNSHESDG